MKRTLFYIATLFSLSVSAQEFQNGGLEGRITGISQQPPGWTYVPVDDPVCIATGDGTLATPDLTDANGPTSSSGIMGNPHGGLTFVSGRTGEWSDDEYYQEGIEQEVSGFTIGETYFIDFYQTVVKEDIAMDPSGAWEVYFDNTLAGRTDISQSKEKLGSLKNKWELRSVQFVATKKTHTIKFLPVDDDNDHVCHATNPNGAVRMGIDDIAFRAGKPLQVTVVEGPVLHSLVVNNADSAAVELSIYSGYKTDPEKTATIPLGTSELDLSALKPGDYRLEFICSKRKSIISFQVK